MSGDDGMMYVYRIEEVRKHYHYKHCHKEAAKEQKVEIDGDEE